MNDSLAQEIIDLGDDPQGLEILYRRDPAAFAIAFSAALARDPESTVLRVWQARLSFSQAQAASEPIVSVPSDRATVWLVVFLCLVSGTIAKIPSFLGVADIRAQDYYSRNIAFFFLPALAGYFIAQRRLSRGGRAIICAFFLLAAVAINSYPRLLEVNSAFKGDASATNYLAALHLPFFLWAVVGLAFAAERWREWAARVSYFRITGEAIVYFALIMITGGLMTGLTIALFESIKIPIHKWYFEWIAIYGACSAPIVATHLAFIRMRSGSTIAPLLARIFSPLALLTLVAYLGAMLIQHRSPLADREFLIVFNAMLLSVLGIAIFCICERTPGRFFDAVLCGLVLVALAVDAVALFAIIYRLTSFGLSPNRIATLGSNVLGFVNLLGILIMFTPAARRGSDAIATKKWIGRFLPVYGIWTAFVVFVFPWLFRFR